jgi:Histone H1-like protein Hc1
MADDDALKWSGSERRLGEDRRKEERRREDLGPPDGKPERRMGERRLFDRRAQGSTTGQLLVEVGRFAAENMVFRQKSNKAAARRARKHLSLIMKLAKQRRAEISDEMKGGAGGASDAAEADQPDDSADD